MVAKIITSGLIMRDDGRFLLVKRSKTDNFMPGLWELPGGKSEETESPDDSTVRELKEETGLDVEVGAPFNIEFFLFKNNEFCLELFYECKMINSNQEIKLSEEHSEFAWVNFFSLPIEDIDEYVTKVLQKAHATLSKRK